MLRMYSLSAQDLFFKYEAFLMSRPSGLRQKLSKFNLDVARELRKEIQRESQSKASKAASSVNNGDTKVAGVRRKNAAVADLGGFLDGLSTPVKKRNVATQLSNTSNNANVPSPSSMSTPHRTPTGPIPTASSYRPSGPSRLAVPVSTPLGKDGIAPSSPVSGAESPNG
ncbi:alpha DNA polymerase [Trichosporon asahii var. asahii CBS 2479]|uniref:Alpha DNA polymerase n=1 Tax=Trichosporon asahii var. asahii (strain ATCC 90039 / CBS 2479 / JCM 2466 / KCTC 7840 / NBRC 103889/ NCYC 2677 / UAMH 7654) TaxID=1186058 RepID=J4UDA1_TRIAS|nr:alpha DNA polymerase [Trichosporon asahii var. asahii CBS 2479]EJT49075.1 alpha DNA polymerase [Trichosporon asahii var. asahii CBS 2479]